MRTSTQTAPSSSSGLTNLRKRRNAVRKCRTAKIQKGRTNRRTRPLRVKTASLYIDDEAFHTDQEISSTDIPESREQIESDSSSFIDDSEQPSDNEDTSVHVAGLLQNHKINSQAAPLYED